MFFLLPSGFFVIIGTFLLTAFLIVICLMSEYIFTPACAARVQLLALASFA
jgi:hypothetical protein